MLVCICKANETAVMKEIKMFLCNFIKDEGRFLFWKWELWEVGGGGGVCWWFLGIDVYPSRLSPLWLIFNWQRTRH